MLYQHRVTGQDIVFVFVFSGSSTTEYGIAMGAAVVAVLLVLFGVGLCLCVILQYLRQQRDGPEGQYRPALSRDVYSVEAVNLGVYYIYG